MIATQQLINQSYLLETFDNQTVLEEKKKVLLLRSGLDGNTTINLAKSIFFCSHFYSLPSEYMYLLIIHIVWCSQVVRYTYNDKETCCLETGISDWCARPLCWKCLNTKGTFDNDVGNTSLKETPLQRCSAFHLIILKQVSQGRRSVPHFISTVENQSSIYSFLESTLIRGNAANRSL